jgi:hypothetical protein
MNPNEYKRDHYVIDGYVKSIKRYIAVGGGRSLEAMIKLAKKPYYRNNFNRIRIRKIVSTVVWKNR